MGVSIDGAVKIVLLREENKVFEYVAEWTSSYANDLLANAILMIILQQDANLMSPIVCYVGGRLCVGFQGLGRTGGSHDRPCVVLPPAVDFSRGTEGAR